MKYSIFRRALQTCALIALAVTAATATAAGYFAQAGKIYDPTGQELQLRGISHHGFNAPILQPQFLWSMGWKQQIAQMKSLGFNAIRLPFVPDTLYSTTPVDKLSYIDAGLNPELIGKTPLQVLDLWMAEADRQGMYVLLDFHSVSAQRQYPTWFVSNPADFGLVYNNQAYTKENWTRDLAFVAKRYAGLAHFFAIDIYNEPNGIVRWSTGDANSPNPIYFWKDAAELASAAVLAANPNLLIFVQGINGNFDGREKSSISMNWGEDFQPQAYQPLNIPNDKLVLTPHTYGPDVFVKSSFSAANFPANLAADWDALFGQFYPAHPVVVGEWGGKYGTGTGGSMDITWQNTFVDYLKSKGISSSFFWCYTPNSGDTGGILDDSLNVRQDKLALLQKLWGAAGAPAPVTPSAATPVTPPVVAPVTPPAAAPVTPPAASPVTPAAATPVTPPAAVPVTPPTAAPVTPAVGGAAPVQQSIMSFAPASGPVGTVVTLSGSGFSGSNAASVGAAKNAIVTVLSDTQLQVTIPADATTGAIGVFNPTYVAFTASSFSVTAAAPAEAPAATPLQTVTVSATPLPSSSGGGGGATDLATLFALGLATLLAAARAPAARGALLNR